MEAKVYLIKHVFSSLSRQHHPVDTVIGRANNSTGKVKVSFDKEVITAELSDYPALAASLCLDGFAIVESLMTHCVQFNMPAGDCIEDTEFGIGIKITHNDTHCRY